jgi:hypothetical protein
MNPATSPPGEGASPESRRLFEPITLNQAGVRVSRIGAAVASRTMMEAVPEGERIASNV